MKYMLSINLLIVIVLLILVGIYTYIDSRQFILEGFTSNNENGSKLVLFYADWCGHCKKMKPDWNKAKSEFPNRCQDIEHKQITQEHQDQYDIKGYPSIFTVNKDGEIEEWKGGRSYSDFRNYLNNN